jgi:hypothetical protein
LSCGYARCWAYEVGRGDAMAGEIYRHRSK